MELRHQTKSFRISKTTRPANYESQVFKGKERPKSLFKKNSEMMKKRYLKVLAPFRIKEMDPRISASAWGILDLETKQIHGSNLHEEREIASLTKIVTCIVAIELAERYRLTYDVILKVSKNAVKIPGTSANLVQNTWIKLVDLFHALMLPSGNDAAWVIAECFGLLINYENLKARETMYQDIQSIDTTVHPTTDHFVSLFLEEMNNKCRQLNACNTYFSNPHGLSKPANYSTVRDLLLLTKYSLTHSLFSQIVGTQSYTAQILNGGSVQAVEWRNTNRLLENGWGGVKTGQTGAAGSCLSSIKDEVMLVVLNSSSLDKRFEDSERLLQLYRQWKSAGV